MKRRAFVQSTTLVGVAFLSLSAWAGVFVEPSVLVINESSTISPGSYVHYSIRLPAGTRLLADVTVQGGLTDSMNIWLVDLNGFQKLEKGQAFSYFRGAGGRISTHLQFQILIPRTDLYYLVLDNRDALLASRSVRVRVHKTVAHETSESRETKALYEGLYNDYLRKVFVFDDFDIYVRWCGQTNAFSNRDILMCWEMEEELTKRRLPGAILFVFLHEAAHSLMRAWDLPLEDNEDAADEMATILLMLIKQEDLALQAAQFWAQDSSELDAVRKLYVDDRHSISPQRARNIVSWLQGDQARVSRWLRMFIPHLTRDMLQELADQSDDPKLSSLAGLELQSRVANGE